MSLYYAAKAGDDRKVERLIKAGADIAQRGDVRLDFTNENIFSSDIYDIYIHTYMHTKLIAFPKNSVDANFKQNIMHSQ